MSRRLVTVTHFFPAHGGGVELVAEQLVRRFSASGMSVQWFSSATDPAPAAADNQVAVGVPTLNIVERLTQLPYPLWSPSVWPALWRAIGSADIVHVHEHLYCGSLLATLMARLRRRPLVVTQHMGALGLQNRPMTLLYETGARLLGAVVFRAAARAIFISANVRGFFRLSGAAHTRLIFNGIETERFTPAAPEQRQQLMNGAIAQAAAGRRIVLFVGRFVRKKGLRLLQTLAPRFPQVLWVFVGSGPETPAQWGYENVLVAGRVSHEKLVDYYRAADLLMLPSSGEGFPLVVQEALACGLGVLTTEEVANACPPARDLMRAQPTPGPDESAEPWERALRETLTDSAYLGAREARARRAHELWSWDHCASQYLSLFDELAS